MLFRSVAATAASSSQLYSFDANAVQEFVAGVVDGLINKDDLPEIQKCMTNTKTVSTEVMAIANEIAKGDMADVIKGVTDAIKLIQELPADLKDCQNLQGDLTKIENWGKQFITPSGLEKVVQNVMSNWSTIQTDIGTINTDLSGAKYMDAGEMTADVVILALGKIQLHEYNMAMKSIY